MVPEQSSADILSDINDVNVLRIQTVQEFLQCACYDGMKWPETLAQLQM